MPKHIIAHAFAATIDTEFNTYTNKGKDRMTLRKTLLGTATLTLFALPTLAQDADLMVFDWSGFEDPELHQAYTEKYGTSPSFSFFADDDEAFQKIASGFKTDVAHPCSQMIGKYRDAGLIEPWDTSRIAEFGNLNPAFLNSSVFKDDSGTWFLPTDWASTAIAWNTEKVPAADVASLNVFLDPKYAGRVSIADNTDDAWALALLATGVSDWTSVSDAQFAAAAEWMRKAHANVRVYWQDPAELAQLMASGEVLVAWSWPDSVTQLQSDGYPIGFQREAAEGSSAFLCGYINIKDAPGSEDKAYDFMNAWYEDRSAVALLNNFGYGHANAKAMAQFDAATLTSSGLGDLTVPVLNQLPIPGDVRGHMQEEFEKIKAGF